MLQYPARKTLHKYETLWFKSLRIMDIIHSKKTLHPLFLGERKQIFDIYLYC